jgi:transposase-like protein
MKNPACEQIQARKVKARLRMLQHAKRLSGNVSQTCRFFGVSRALYYIWKKRYEKNGLAGLRDLPRRPQSTGDRFPDSSHSGRAALRRASSQSLSSTALSRLRITDDDPEDL